MQYLYLGILLFSITGLVIADLKFKSFFFSNKRLHFLLTIFIVLLVFIIVDLAGTLLSIFTSNPQYITGIYILPDIPLEELFFLILAAYSSIWIAQLTRLYD